MLSIPGGSEEGHQEGNTEPFMAQLNAAPAQAQSHWKSELQTQSTCYTNNLSWQTAQVKSSPLSKMAGGMEDGISEEAQCANKPAGFNCP